MYALNKLSELHTLFKFYLNLDVNARMEQFTVQYPRKLWGNNGVSISELSSSNYYYVYHTICNIL